MTSEGVCAGAPSRRPRPTCIGPESALGLSSGKPVTMVTMPLGSSSPAPWAKVSCLQLSRIL